MDLDIFEKHKDKSNRDRKCNLMLLQYSRCKCLFRFKRLEIPFEPDAEEHLK